MKLDNYLDELDPKTAQVEQAQKKVHFTITPITSDIKVWREAQAARKIELQKRSNEAYESKKESIVELWLSKDRAEVKGDVESRYIDKKTGYLTWVEKQKKIK